MDREKQNWVRRFFYSVRQKDCCPWNGATVCDSCGRKWGEKCPINPYGVYDQACFDKIK